MVAVVIGNPHRTDDTYPPPPRAVIREFHQRLPGFEPTELRELPELADDLGIGRLLVKAENNRFGLPSFKILGASWATYQGLVDRLGSSPEPWADPDELRSRFEVLGPLSLITATDGNHGRAVARMASLLGLSARIFVPAGTAEARQAAIRSEGAEVVVVEGDYDDSVAVAAGQAGEQSLIISDTSWPGYELTPRRVAEGYSTIFDEIDEQAAALGASLDLVVVPVGVGALMAAAVAHLRAGQNGPTLVGVEPIGANCVQASIERDAMTHVAGPHLSIMAGLNCGYPSEVAWPLLRSGVDAYVSVGDDAARTAMRDLASGGLAAGETGGAALAGLRALVDHAASGDQSTIIGSDPARITALVIMTEGPTDPEKFAEIVGRSADELSAP